MTDNPLRMKQSRTFLWIYCDNCAEGLKKCHIILWVTVVAINFDGYATLETVSLLCKLQMYEISQGKMDSDFLSTA